LRILLLLFTLIFLYGCSESIASLNKEPEYSDTIELDYRYCYDNKEFAELLGEDESYPLLLYKDYKLHYISCNYKENE
jgi:hypothetical protein